MGQTQGQGPRGDAGPQRRGHGQSGPVQGAAPGPPDVPEPVPRQVGQGHGGDQVPAGRRLEGVEGGNMPKEPGIQGREPSQGEQRSHQRGEHPKAIVSKADDPGPQSQQEGEDTDVHRVFPRCPISPHVARGWVAEHPRMQEVQKVPGPEGILQGESLRQSTGPLGNPGVLGRGRELPSGQEQRQQARGEPREPRRASAQRGRRWLRGPGRARPGRGTQ